MFVTDQDFDVAPYSLPNLDKVVNSFAAFIEKKEEEALRQLLGHVLYDEFVEGLAELPEEWDAGTDYAVDELVILGNDIWKSLQNPNTNQPVEEGAYWTIDEEDNKWLLLKNGAAYSTKRKWNGMNKLLVPFIYATWRQDGYSNDSGNGEVVANVENGKVISPKRKIVAAWNDFSRMAGNGCSKVDSLYGFIKANEDTYENFIFSDPGRMNIFNL